MADQQRWFKLWCSVLTDDGLQSLPACQRWAWAALGCYVKLNGTHGTAEISPNNHALAGALGVTADALLMTISALPHVRVEEGKSVNGTFTVTFENWRVYQEDRTVAERMRRYRERKSLRSKRRGEESRGEEKRIPPTKPPQTDVKPIPPSILDALHRTPVLGAVPRLQTPAFWQATIRATEGRIEYGQELLRAEAWLAANPTRAPRKDLARFVHNWIVRAGERL